MKIDISNEEFYNKNFDWDKWHKKWQEEYHNHRFINLKEELESKDIELLQKFGIEIKDILYTNYEFDVIFDLNLLAYYRNEKEMTQEELDLSEPLPKNVSRQEYNKLIDKFNNISKKYNL